MRDVIIGNEAREGILRGLNLLANAVKVTLGPHGNVVMWNSVHEGTRVSKDGVTVAQKVELKDNLESMGADILRQASQRTADVAGDGTTTSTVIAQHLVNSAMKMIKSSQERPIVLKRQMEEALKQIEKDLRAMSISVLDEKMIQHVATISANNDYILGEIIAGAFKDVGLTGKVRIDKSHSDKTYVDVLRGLQFPSGYHSPYFSTDADSRQVIYEDGVDVLVIDTKLTKDLPVQNILRLATQKPIVIYCNEIDNAVLSQIVISKLRSNANICLVKSPYYAKKRTDALEDICAQTGAYHIKESEHLKQFSSKMFGKADKAVVTSNSSLLMGGNGEIEPYVQELKAKLESADSRYENERLDERISRLTTGVAVIYVGGDSDVEIDEKKDRVDDAVKAVEAALKEGILPGGGSALYHTVKGKVELDNLPGAQLLYDACGIPLLQISYNSGNNEQTSLKIFETLYKSDFNIGWDFKKDKAVNMVESGIIDPTLVVISALKNAVSVASMLILTECALPTVGDREEGLPAYLKS